jgi:predicted regulator of amino acid metabolism with ACT domain
MGLYSVKAAPKQESNGILMIAVSNEKDSTFSTNEDGTAKVIQTVNFKVPGKLTDSGDSVKVAGYTLFKAKDRKVAGTFITLNEEQLEKLIKTLADAYTQITNKAIVLDNNVVEVTTTSPVKPEVTIEERDNEVSDLF